MTNSHSPQQRLARYRQELGKRIAQRGMYIATFFALWMYTISLVQLDLSRRGLLANVLLVPMMLIAGDLYSVVRDFIERRIYCPRYDKASQPRPQFEVRETVLVMYVRAWIYIIIVPILPTSMFVILNFCGQLPWHYAIDWSIALVVSLLFGTLRLMNWPVTIRAMLRPFKRVPSPDVN